MLMLIAALTIAAANNQTADALPPNPPAAGSPIPQTVALPKPAVRARPLGDQGQWVTLDDYPPIALAERREGTVEAMLRVNRLGFVENCTIMRSSGHADLDQTTCTAIQVRAFFEPARDAAGEPMTSDVPKRIRWVIPVDPAPTTAAPTPVPSNR